MNIRSLRLFRLIVSEGSLAAAAKAMNMSAPAASRLVTMLEAETKLQLFHRTRRHLTLTTDGQSFYHEAAHILAGFDEIPKIASEILHRSEGLLRLVTAPRIGQGLVSPALALFRGRHPHIKVSVDIRSRFDIEGRVGERLYDLGVISLPVTHPSVEITNHPFFRLRIEAFLPADHPLSAKAALSASDLAKEPLLGLWPGQRWRQQVDDFFGSGGENPKYVIETQSSLMACQLANDGAGIAILDRLCAQAVDSRRMTARPLEPERWMLFGYIHQARQPLGSNAAAFIDCMREVLERFRGVSAENARAVVPLWDNGGDNDGIAAQPLRS